MKWAEEIRDSFKPKNWAGGIYYYRLIRSLLTKYGPVDHDFFENNSFVINDKVSRLNEGLLCHHINSDKAIRLYDVEYAKKNPFEYQYKNRLVYCNIFEYLQLHIEISLAQRNPDANPTEYIGFDGVLNTVKILNDFYNGYDITDTRLVRATEIVKDRFDEYVEILNKYIENLISRTGTYSRKKSEYYRLISQKGNDKRVKNIVYKALAKRKEKQESTVTQEYIAELKQKLNGYEPDLAARELGLIYGFGFDGVKINKKLAFYYLSMASELSFYESGIEDVLAEYYEYGYGTKIDYTKAFSFYLMAAESGQYEGNEEHSMYKVGIFYLRGEGVPENKKEGIRWLKKAAYLQYSDAQYALGRYYKRNIRGKRTVRKYLKFMQDAANQNHADALFELGILHYKGLFVNKDLIRAQNYLLESERFGSLLGLDFLNRFFGRDCPDIERLLYP